MSEGYRECKLLLRSADCSVCRQSQADWKAEGAITDQEAVEKFNSTFDLVLIGGGVEESSEKKLKTTFEKINPQLKMIRHYGGGSGLLFNEIQEAISL